MRIAILGFGEQGKAALAYWGKAGNEVTVCDQDESLALPGGVSGRLGKDYLSGLDEFDLLVRTPALHPREIVAANPDQPNLLGKVTSVTNEFMKVCPSRNIIGVTGTKGKGTTSTLIAKMLEASGKTVHLGGNIGTPPLELLDHGIQPDDWVVLELANFQLIDLKISPPIAVCLMVTPEHMDWHEDFEEYIAAKQQLFINQGPDDRAIYNAKNDHSISVADASVGKQIPYLQPPGAEVRDNRITIGGQTICDVQELKLLGKHNWENVCAAVTTVWQITQDTDAMRSVLTSFSGLPHRLEFVRELDGIKYYDDSFGTTPETAIVAIEAFDQPKVVIMGGSDKDAAFDTLAEAVVKNNVRAVLTIGETGPKIAAALRQKGYSNISEGGQTMVEIVSAARQLASSGDVVLLSTGCASFGLFKNYKDRGEQFKQAVMAMQ